MTRLSEAKIAELRAEAEKAIFIVHVESQSMRALLDEVDALRKALERIASSNLSDMSTPHPEHCAVIARRALSDQTEAPE